MRLSRSHFLKAAANTKPAMNIQIIGSVKDVREVFQVTILDNENTIGGISAAMPRGTHSVTHQVSTHRRVPSAIWGARPGTSISAAASAIDCGSGMMTMRTNIIGPRIRPTLCFVSHLPTFLGRDRESFGSPT